MLHLLAIAALCQTPAAPPTIDLKSDDLSITQSCIIRIAPDAVLKDANNNGVIHIDADGITVEFAPESTLRGSSAATPGDQLTGIGIRLHGHKDVTLKDLKVSGFKIAVQADDCPGLTVETSDLSGNYRQHLKSTAVAEDGADWLFPHNNDKDEWMTQHGAALAVKNASKVTLRNIKVRAGQNGIILDRVTDSVIYDNDCSFLSGWGLAMWRSSRNLISRNALDFCIRGYSHEVYNRGQDSAGLLMFEQCSANVIAENSITHGGDGIFGFAGREALGESPAPSPDFSYKRTGCNDNIFADNDLSYAAAHGLEMTFSQGNRIIKNRMVSNAICGIWGGYSSDTLIAENTFEDNGGMAYGLERGGINIEHGTRNMIVGNTFKGNKCAVHMWWNDNKALLAMPGVAEGNGGAVLDNVIAGNTFSGDLIGLQLRDSSPGKDKVQGTIFTQNTMADVKTQTAIEEGIKVATTGDAPMYMEAPLKLLGNTHPVGARKSLAGRQNIIMTEWGPWDHESPLMVATSTSEATHHYKLYNFPKDVKVSVVMADGRAPVDAVAIHWSPNTSPQEYDIALKKAGVASYTLTAEAGAARQQLKATFVKTDWQISLFTWQGETNPPAPPPSLEAWRDCAKDPKAIQTHYENLNFPFGGKGPTAIKKIPAFANSGIGGGLYGLIASTSLPLTPGTWTISTMSDDGIRVIVDGKSILENWTHHGPTKDTGTFELKEAKTVPITVEYFQIGGHAVLDWSIEKVK